MAGDTEELKTMSQEDKNKNIILVGMMATGKSTVGAILVGAGL